MIGLLLTLIFGLAAVSHHGTTRNFEVPKGWPNPQYDFKKSPLTEEGIVLGRKLFYDPILSRNNTVSCASCHLSYTAFTHVDHDLSHGIEDRIGTRNSMALSIRAWSSSFMWDGAVNHLDMQALAPISHPSEMDEDLGNVVKKISKLSEYRARFWRAFGDSRLGPALDPCQRYAASRPGRPPTPVPVLGSGCCRAKRAGHRSDSAASRPR